MIKKNMNTKANKENATVGANAIQLAQAMESSLARNTMNNRYRICGKSIASVPTELCVLDHEYQREINAEKLRAIIAEWDFVKECGFLEVSYRDGKFYVIDGQHRYMAAKYLGVEELPCIIFTGLTQRDEALRFARQNRNAKKPSIYDEFKANICNGDDSIPEVKIDMQIKAICDVYKVKVKKAGRMNTTEMCLRLSPARDTVRVKGIDCFEWIMKTIYDSNWRDCPEAYLKEFYVILESFYCNNKDNILEKEKEIFKVLNTYTPTQLEAKANSKRYVGYGSQTRMKMALRDAIDELNQ